MPILTVPPPPITVTLSVRVTVDPSTPLGVLTNEVRSNLESVDYVVGDVLVTIDDANQG